MRLIGLAIAALIVAAAAAAAQEPAGPTRWAVVVGVREYTADSQLATLEYSANDARLVKQVLTTHCQFPDRQVVLMTDEPGTESSRLPFRGQVKNAVTNVCRMARQGDTVLIFFSGHGVPLADGGVVLAARDCEKRQAAQTGIPLSWLIEELEKKCAATQKVLVLDCCHAGAGRAAGESLALEPCFKQAQGLAMLASCMEEELSHEWPKVKQGLFTYWFCKGLQDPAADVNGNGVVDFDELHTYVFNNVSRTAFHELNLAQHPQQHHSSNATGVFELAWLNRPDAPYPVRAASGSVWSRKQVYTEAYTIHQPGQACTAEFEDAQQQRVEVQKTDKRGRPTNLRVKVVSHQKVTRGQLPNRPPTTRLRGPLQGQVFDLEWRSNGGVVVLPGGIKNRAPPSLVHPLFLEESLLPESPLPVLGSTADPGRLAALLEVLAPQANVRLDTPPTITSSEKKEGGRVVVFKGQAGGTGCVAMPAATHFDADWTVEYDQDQKRVRRIWFRAESKRLLRGTKELSLVITCDVSVEPAGK